MVGAAGAKGVALDRWWAQAPGWRSTVVVFAAIAQGLARCEGASLFPGALSPKAVWVDPVGVRAEALVRGLVGAPVGDGSSGGLSRWTAPAQARGAAWDNAANRYVLGLMLYRALAGRHPFRDKGLRLELAEQEGRGAPPLPDDVARTLPPGLQSYCLRLLDPDPRARPSSAAQIGERLRRFAVAAGATQRPVAVRPQERDAGARSASVGRASREGTGSASVGLGLHDRPAFGSVVRGSHDGAGSASVGLGLHDGAGSASVGRASHEGTGSASVGLGLHDGPAFGSVVRGSHEGTGSASVGHGPSPAPHGAAGSARHGSGQRSGQVYTQVQVPAGLTAGSNAPPSKGRRFGRLRRWVGAVLPLGVGVALAWGLAPQQRGVAPVVRQNVGSRASLRADQTRADDCATCHPEQTAQWHASVMAHSVKSPLFQGLEMLIEEQVGKSFDCPGGAGALRQADPRRACVDPSTGLPITGSGGALWCVNCHSPTDNLDRAVPRWDGISRRSTSRKPLRDLLPAATMEGISCAFCHQAHGPGRLAGNPTWTSTQTGERFDFRPEERRGVSGIGNSGYELDPAEFVASLAQDGARLVPGGVHVRPTEPARAYLQSSQFCGACHDVRLFQTDAIQGVARGEHFKRLRNAYSEWVDWGRRELAAGREPASCQDCHMSLFPGVCLPGDEVDAGPLSDAFSRTTYTALERGCPPGTRFSPRAPGARPDGSVATNSSDATAISTHYLTGVDVPLTPEFPAGLIDDLALDAHGVPRGAMQRRDLLLGKSFRFELDAPRRGGGRLEIPVEIENTGAGHKIPAGFSQEREFWVHLRVTDDRGRVLYEVGRIDRNDQDLRDKIFVRVNVDDRFIDENGQPQGVFGADVVDGPDVPQWRPAAGSQFRGRGLINLQNGFLRCVTCIGTVDRFGQCQPVAGQGRHRADRFDDGAYDPDTGECVSNLFGDEKFLEVYFPVGALDSSRGATKGPDAIIDDRSAPPGVPQRYVYELADAAGPIHVEARLMFRAFPPFLVRTFADYEVLQDRKGLRPSGPLVTYDALQRLDVVEIAKAEVTIP